ncbi:MalY/PatB family protein [Leucobacter denitrificans]|uniref:cysteine-S-conjugate beta-lyase n=1 Tax=Leucobacter denitrificans TaxID=683042 RepID=A0A7G9S1Y9_9MICO|nr:aminotransferase class I/II-fold pyridoxal phosphate-dependent enzyme [Leucobacter denitrificans]QNN61864.1 aminotransferase class I/II-fold pyridoxal phosphate-dependent enzyme [Leucobacter denitrificans]
MSDCPAPQLPLTDASGVPFSALDPALLREQRRSIKWTRFPADVLPLFVAEMDFTVAPAIKRELIERIEHSDTGYLEGAGDLAVAFAEFARDRWGWEISTSHVRLATDVATGVVESLRVWLKAHGAAFGVDRAPRIALPVPVYPGFFEMLEEVPFEIVELPLTKATDADADAAAAAAAAGGSARLDFAAIEREFASERGIDAFLLCNPHNPHGLVHTREELAELARLAAKHEVFVVSDEIHAPLTHAGETFTPFAPLAATAGALAVTTTSASKGWNLAGTKCSVIVAADERANELLKLLPPETEVRASILGLHASIAAFRDARDWLDATVAQIESNIALFAELADEHLPGVTYTIPKSSYLVWLDFRDAGLGENPYARLLRDAKVALNDGVYFGAGGESHARINLACAPDTIREAVRRIAQVLPQADSTQPEAGE